MSNINVLPFSIANLIAAGEVVDRPASVVKELLENAIDAGSTRINIEIQNGGVSLIRVSDNGCGMTPEDLGISVLRHATSKIKEEADLSRIMTLGFRGEALAATAAVSQMRIISKTSELPYGAMLTVHGGEILSLEERGAVNGTTVIVERLFYNVPARLKFLKRDATEALAVTSVVEKTALAHPEIAFHYLIDGSTKILTAGDGDRRSVLNHFYGKAFASRLIEVNSGEGPVHIEGYISRPDNVRPNRNYQNFFLNGRYIRSRTIGAALEQAYVSFIAPEKFPCCTLYVDIDPSAVDINVHPAKLEVKFSNEKAVFDTVYYTVRSALEVNRDRPEIDLGRATAPSAFMPTSSEENLARVAENEEQAARKRVTEAFVPVVDRVAGDTPPKQIRMDVGTLPTRSTRHAETETVSPETVRVSVSLPKTGTGASTDPTVPPSKEAPKPSHPAPPAPPVLTRSQSRAVRASFQEALNETPAEPEAVTVRTEIPKTVEPVPEKPADVPPVPEAVAVQAEAVALSPEEPAAPAEAPVPAEADAPTESADPEKPANKDYRIIGEAFHSYILVERFGDGDPELLLVDKHAAHERIIFEQLKERMHQRLDSGAQESQLLLVPLEFMLDHAETETLLRFSEEIEALGFLFEHGNYTVSVSAVPVGFELSAVEDFFRTIGGSLSEYGGDPTLKRDLLFEKALYQAACKAAVKAGRVYTEESNEYIIRTLMTYPDITCCPHGRPVAIVLPKKKLDAQFKRT